MKFALLAIALACLPISVSAAPAAPTLGSQSTTETDWAKIPMVLTRDDNGVVTEGSRSPYNTFGNGDGIVVSGEDDIWNLRPDMPKKKMVDIGQGTFYLKRADGLLDSRVVMVFSLSKKVVVGFKAINELDSRVVPKVNVSEDTARKTAYGIANKFVEQHEDGTTTTWPYVYERHQPPYTAIVATDELDALYIYYSFMFYLSDQAPMPVGDAEKSRLPQLFVSVNATTGDVFSTFSLMPRKPGASMGTKTNKAVSRYPAVTLTCDTREVYLGYPCLILHGMLYVPMTVPQKLAKGHRLTAKAGDDAMVLNDKRVKLPAKVVDRKGMLYLPWQALKSLPGIKCSYNAKQGRLDITTAPAANKTK